MRKITYIRPPKDFSPQLRGLCERVACQLNVDAMYVGQVARGERESLLVEKALEKEIARIVQQEGKNPCRHEVQFYSDDKVLLDRLVPFIAAALKNGDAAIVVATQSHRSDLAQRLKLEGLDIESAMKAGVYVAVDAPGTLSMFMANDMPKPARFLKVVGGLIEEAATASKAAHPRVAVFGEWVSLLWKEGKADAAILLEQLWNNVAGDFDIDLLCGYEMSSNCGEQDNSNFERVRAEHTAVYSHME